MNKSKKYKYLRKNRHNKCRTRNIQSGGAGNGGEGESAPPISGQNSDKKTVGSRIRNFFGKSPSNTRTGKKRSWNPFSRFTKKKNVKGYNEIELQPINSTPINNTAAHATPANATGTAPHDSANTTGTAKIPDTAAVHGTTAATAVHGTTAATAVHDPAAAHNPAAAAAPVHEPAAAAAKTPEQNNATATSLSPDQSHNQSSGLPLEQQPEASSSEQSSNKTPSKGNDKFKEQLKLKQIIRPFTDEEIELLKQSDNEDNKLKKKGHPLFKGIKDGIEGLFYFFKDGRKQNLEAQASVTAIGFATSNNEIINSMLDAYKIQLSNLLEEKIRLLKEEKTLRVEKSDENEKKISEIKGKVSNINIEFDEAITQAYDLVLKQGALSADLARGASNMNSGDNVAMYNSSSQGSGNSKSPWQRFKGMFSSKPKDPNQTGPVGKDVPPAGPQKGPQPGQPHPGKEQEENEAIAAAAKAAGKNPEAAKAVAAAAGAGHTPETTAASSSSAAAPKGPGFGAKLKAGMGKLSGLFSRTKKGGGQAGGGGEEDNGNNKTRKNRQYIHEIKENRTQLFNKEMEIINSIRNFKHGHNHVHRPNENGKNKPENIQKKFIKVIKRS